MVNRIEKLLFEKTETKRSHILCSQWGIAKEYVFDVLSTISHVFPHYRLHDRTHSESIINNIIRIMGVDMLDKMTATDLWLLLCSAYYHDLGMAVTAIDKELTISNSDFVNFIKDIQEDNTSSLYIHANYFEIKDNKIFYKNNELKSYNYYSSRLLLAVFIR